MLSELTIRNFAIIDHLELIFDEGLNVLTGETGAGKSIILDALGLLCGDKAEKNSFFEEDEPIVVEALFRLEASDGLSALLSGLDLALEDGELLVRREVTVAGRSRCRINSQMVRLQDLKVLGEFLAAIHSQHDSHALLDEKKHSRFFYGLGGAGFQKHWQDWQVDFEDYARLKKRALDAEERLREIERERARLQIEVEEIGTLNLSAGEEEELNQRHSALVHSQEIQERLLSIQSFLDASSEGSLMHQFAFMNKELKALHALDTRSLTTQEALNSLVLNFEDLRERVSDFEDAISNTSGEELESLEERIASIESLKRRFGGSVEEVLSYERQAAETLFSLEKESRELQGLGDRIPALERELVQKAAKFTALKSDLKKEIEKRVHETLVSLAMPHARFEVGFIPDASGFEVGQENSQRLGPEGFERIRFLLSPNQGQPLMPLAKVASGGEVSRVMLALRKVFAAVQTVGTLIFDEIDTGIGGDTAHRLAEVVAEIARSRQSIVITHLVQMALPASAHFRVEKEIRNNRTLSSVRKLEADQRKEELVRMMGLSGQDVGGEIVDQMLRRHQEAK